MSKKTEKCETPDKLELGFSIPDDVKEEVNCLYAYVNKNRYNYNVVKAMIKSIDELCDNEIQIKDALIKAVNKCVKKEKKKCN